MEAAAMLYRRRDEDRDKLAALGFTEAMIDKATADNVTEVWPENWRAVVLFDNLRGEWNIGPRGPVGLRRDGVLAEMRLSGIEESDWTGLLGQIRIMERTALEEMHRGG